MLRSPLYWSGVGLIGILVALTLSEDYALTQGGTLKWTWLAALGATLVAIFFVSGADAASIVMGTLSANGALEPGRRLVIFWGVATGAVAAVMLLAGGSDPAEALNGLKNVLGLFVNAVGSLVFIVTAPELIDWRIALLVAVGAITGGVLGARYGRRLPANVLRAVIVVLGLVAIVRILTL